MYVLLPLSGTVKRLTFVSVPLRADVKANVRRGVALFGSRLARVSTRIGLTVDLVVSGFRRLPIRGRRRRRERVEVERPEVGWRQRLLSILDLLDLLDATDVYDFTDELDRL